VITVLEACHSAPSPQAAASVHRPSVADQKKPTPALAPRSNHKTAIVAIGAAVVAVGVGLLTVWLI
jgi:hypothetical protein